MKKVVLVLFFTFIFPEVGIYSLESISISAGSIKSYMCDTRNGNVYEIVSRKKRVKVCDSNLESKDIGTYDLAFGAMTKILGIPRFYLVNTTDGSMYEWKKNKWIQTPLK